MAALAGSLIAVGAAALAFAVGGAGAADWSCGARADSSGHVKAIFGHTDDRAAASALARRVRRAFHFVRVEQVGCADWQVYVSGLDTPRQQRDFAHEAEQTGFPGVSFRTTADLTAAAVPGTVKAVFGTYRTASAASRTLQRAAAAGFRLAGIGRFGLHVFKVVLPGIPVAQSRAFAAEAGSAGLRLTYELQ